MVCHDETVDRTTNSRGTIDNLSWAELEGLDNAYWFVDGRGAVRGEPDDEYVFRGRANADKEFRIARLDDVFDRYTELVINLDIKRCEPSVKPYDNEVVDMIRRFDRAETTIVASFHDLVVERIAINHGDIYVSAGPSAVAVAWQASRTDEALPSELQAFSALQVPASFGEITVVDQRFVDAAHASDIAVHVWTINEADEMEELLALGVDGIISDRPSVLASVLGL